LADQQAAREGEIILSERKPETRGMLENDMLSRVEAMEGLWRLARRYARPHIPRTVKVLSTIIGIIVVAAGSRVAYLQVQAANLEAETAYQRGIDDQILAQRNFEGKAAETAFLAASITTALNDGQHLDVAAFELGKTFNHLMRLEKDAPDVAKQKS
jgi:hypothetical protein